MSIKNAQIIAVDTAPELYHKQDGQRGAPEFVMSISALKEFQRCPARWRNGYCSPESESKEWGAAIDCYALTPHRFEQRYAIKPEFYPAPATHAQVKAGKIQAGDSLPWNGNAGYCSDWQDAAEVSGKELVSASRWTDLQSARTALFKDEIVKSFIDASDKQVHVVAEWHDKTTGLVIPLKALLDLVPKSDSEFCKSLGDFKSVSTGSPFAFKQTVYKFGYDLQAAFYQDMFVSATKEDRNTFVFILQESFSPFQTGRRMLSQDFVEAGQEGYQNALRDYCLCLKTGGWPGYDDDAEALQGWSLVLPDAYMIESRNRKTKHEQDAPEIEADEVPYAEGDLQP